MQGVTLGHDVTSQFSRSRSRTAYVHSVEKSDAQSEDQHLEDVEVVHRGGGNRAERHPDKALERLVDRSPTRMSVEAAMRARDVSR